MKSYHLVALTLTGFVALGFAFQAANQTTSRTAPPSAGDGDLTMPPSGSTKKSPLASRSQVAEATQSKIDASSRNSPEVDVAIPERIEARNKLLANIVAIRNAMGIKENAHDVPGHLFSKRLLLENYLLNCIQVDSSLLDEWIDKSGCDPTNWSARRMQKHINAWLEFQGEDAVKTSQFYFSLGQHAFGWLGRPGDQTLDIFRINLGLRSGQSLADVFPIVPGDYQVGGIPLRPVQIDSSDVSSARSRSGRDFRTHGQISRETAASAFRLGTIGFDLTEAKLHEVAPWINCEQDENNLATAYIPDWDFDPKYAGALSSLGLSMASSVSLSFIDSKLYAMRVRYEKSKYINVGGWDGIKSRLETKFGEPDFSTESSCYWFFDDAQRELELSRSSRWGECTVEFDHVERRRIAALREFRSERQKEKRQNASNAGF